MVTTDWHYPSVVVNANLRSPHWNNLANVANNVNWGCHNGDTDTGAHPHADISLAKSATTDTVIASNYGFTIPNNARIEGIQAVIIRSGGYITDKYVMLMADNVALSNKALNTSRSDGYFINTSYGSATDKWGSNNITPGIMNDPDGLGLEVILKNIAASSNTAWLHVMGLRATYTDPIYSLTSNLPSIAVLNSQINYQVVLESTNDIDQGVAIPVTVEIPSGFTLVSATSSEGIYNATTHTWTPKLNSSKKATLNIIVAATATGSQSQTVTETDYNTTLTKSCNIVATDSGNITVTNAVISDSATLNNLVDGETYTLSAYNKLTDANYSSIFAGVRNNRICVVNGNGGDTDNIATLNQSNGGEDGSITGFEAAENVSYTNLLLVELANGSESGTLPPGLQAQNSAEITSSTEQAHNGTHSIKVACPGAVVNEGGFITITGLTVGVTYTSYIWVYAPAGAVLQHIIGGSSTGTVTWTTTGWKLVSKVFTATGTSHIWYMRTAGTAQAISFYIDTGMLTVGNNIIYPAVAGGATGNTVSVSNTTAEAEQGSHSIKVVVGGVNAGEGVQIPITAITPNSEQYASGIKVKAPINTELFFKLGNESTYRFKGTKIVNDIGVHQGITGDGTYYYGTSDTFLRKWNSNFNILLTQSMVSYLTGGHIGDIKHHDGKIYVVSETYTNCTTFSNQELSIWNASDLSFIEKHDISAQCKEVAGVTVDSDNGFIYVASYCDPNTIQKYSLSDYSFVGNITLTTPISSKQGIDYQDGDLYITADMDAPKQIYRVGLDGTLKERIAVADSAMGESEGIYVIDEDMFFVIYAESTTNHLYQFLNNFKLLKSTGEWDEVFDTQIPTDTYVKVVTTSATAVSLCVDTLMVNTGSTLLDWVAGIVSSENLGTRVKAQNVYTPRQSVTFQYDSSQTLTLRLYGQYQAVSTTEHDEWRGFALKQGYDDSYGVVDNLLADPEALLDNATTSIMTLPAGASSAKYDYLFDNIPQPGSDDTFFRGIMVTLDVTDKINSGITLQLKSSSGNDSNILSKNFTTENTQIIFGGDLDLWGLSSDDLINQDLTLEVTFNNISASQITPTYSNINLILYWMKDETNGAYGFFYNGVHSRNYGIFVTDISDPEGVDTDITTYDASKMDGSLPTSQDIKSKTVDVEFWVAGDTLPEAKSKLQLIGQWLASIRNDYNYPTPNDLIFDINPERKYQVLLNGKIDNDINVTALECKATFLIPSGMALSAEPISTGATGTNNGISKARPVITVLTDGSSAIVLNDAVSEQQIMINATIASGTILTINCANQTIIDENGVDYIASVDNMNVNFAFAPGADYSIYISGGNIQNVEYYESY